MQLIIQEQVWDNIAEKWGIYRNKSIGEVSVFLKNKKGKVLDLGCGTGRNFLKNNKLKFYGVDFSKQMLKESEKKIKIQGIKALLFKAECYNLPFEDNFFDSAIFISTLHCIQGKKNRIKSLKELHRVLKKGTQALISVWDKENNKSLKNKKISEGFINWHKDNKVYKRYYYFYSRKEIEVELKKAGFKIQSINYRQDKISKHSRKNIVIIVKK
jgi:ubiquinone/menaquinone biosynthesis C-methylase UbiE